MKNKKIINIFNKVFLGLFVLLNFTPVVFAEDDPIAVVNNLSEFIFTLTKGIGGIILAYGTFQFGVSWTSHDSSQRINGLLYMIGGIIIICTKAILNFIAG